MNKVLISFISVIFLILSSSFFIVKEGERGIILRFGKVLRDNEQNTIEYKPGLHLKLPFLETVKMLDSRIYTIENQEDRFVTKEKKDLIIDSYIKWRISDFGRYYLTTGEGDKFQAEVLLRRKFSDRLRSQISRLNVKEVITDAKGNLTNNVLDLLNNGTVNINNTKSFVNINSIKKLGIQVVDIRIKKINLPIEISQTIYNKMKSEKESVARVYRSQGQLKADKLRVAADHKVSIILAAAQKNALIIKGQGEAKVTKLFAEHFSQEPDFYFFIRSLRAYENSFKNNNNFILISTDSEFFKYIKKPFKTKK